MTLHLDFNKVNWTQIRSFDLVLCQVRNNFKNKEGQALNEAQGVRFNYFEILRSLKVISG